MKLARISAERSDHMEDAVDGGDDNAVSAVLGGGSGDDTAEQTLDAAEIVRGAPGSCAVLKLSNARLLFSASSAAHASST